MDDENIDIELTDDNVEEYIKKLREKLKVCQKEKSEYLDGWQRAKADFINARRDEEQRTEDSLRYARSAIYNEFLTLADFIDMAQKHKDSDELKQVARQLSDIFKKQDIQPIECRDEVFNPELHEAVIQAEAEKEDQ